jgi:serine/threonine protein kinase/Flp pilus assembly protein TadD
MSETLSVNSKISHYRIVSKLGAGGMGEVFLAEDTRLDRQVALKILPPEFAEDKERMSRFVREAKSASALNHPNIITIHEIGESDGMHFIATEFIEGKTLNQYAESSPLNLKSVVEIAVQIASALDEAHSAGIVHRDIKPDNVMIRASGLVKILDFGIAKLPATNNQSNPAEGVTAIKGTSPGMIIGTPSYMSPEQAAGKEVDARTDIFSFGVVFYEMLAGKLPFEGETALEMIGAVLKDEPKPLKADVPGEIKKIIGKCLKKDRNERYQTIRDVCNDLKEAKQDLEFQEKSERTARPNQDENKTQILLATTADDGNRATANKAPSNNSSKKYLAVGLAILLISAFGFGYWFFNRSSKQIDSIAVLPFENASGNADLDYLSDGVSESVIDRLSQLPQLKVIARNSSFRYRGQNLNLPEIANALGVDAIVTGRVVPRGDSYQIRVDVTDVRENKQLWGENFTRKASDVQIVQADISREIAENLKLRLSGTQSQQFAKEGTTSPQAYEALVKGRFFFNKPGQDNTDKATEHFEEATAFDPNYALAWSYLANAYAFGGGKDLDRKERHTKRRMAAMKAVELAPNLAEAHFALGQVKFSDWQWAEAEREYKLSIELNPNLAKAYSGLQGYLVVMGRYDEAIAEAKRSVELDPVDYVAATRLSIAFHRARRYDETIETAKRVIEMEPNFFFSHLALADAYAAKGMYKEAIAEYQESLRLRGGDSPTIEAALGTTYVKMGMRAKAEEILESLESRANDFSSTPIDLSLLYDALGRRDEAFAVLEKAYAERASDLGYMRTNPKFDNLRSDPRFADLLRRMNLPPTNN